MSHEKPGPSMSCAPLRVYVLAGILGSDVSLVLNCREQIVTQLLEGSIQEQYLLSEQEMWVISALLEALPEPCSYVVMYAAATEMPQEQVGYFFAEMDEDMRSLALEVLRPVLLRCRGKLLAFNLGIEHVEGIGYQLVRL